MMGLVGLEKGDGEEGGGGDDEGNGETRPRGPFGVTGIIVVTLRRERVGVGECGTDDNKFYRGVNYRW
jgi:hypothetical protein